jgi:hypothetical protein
MRRRKAKVLRPRPNHTKHRREAIEIKEQNRISGLLSLDQGRSHHGALHELGLPRQLVASDADKTEF